MSRLATPVLGPAVIQFQVELFCPVLNAAKPGYMDRMKSNGQRIAAVPADADGVGVGATVRDVTHGPTTTESDDSLLLLWADLLRVSNLVGADLVHRLAPAGRSPDEVELFMQLAAAPERRLRMADVAALLRLGKSNVTRLVDHLEDQGLVMRTACPSDRRVTYVGLTERGRAQLDACAPDFLAALRERLGERLDAAQVAALRGHLGRILQPDDTAGKEGA